MIRPRLYPLIVWLPTPLFHLARAVARLFPATPETPRDRARRVLGEMTRLNGETLDPADIEFVKQMCGERP